ncbi:Natural resistance-associated macrophage protein [Pirellulimonas nuda]|uniref:Natural resistance-associated macrophage protein n=1 Tax=Pirellulimonas nuda TaxID=2528009 RepID=A0A518DAF1_9BACT|nr:Natural resistance-associated macrophage protein [Pirellulimonas nuda]
MAVLRAYVGMSGPGWLQSALTLGGGSLGSSLFLGILAGTSLLWLQPFAMAIGVVMMSAIAYVTLSTGERPFRAINHHINPVLGWSWLAATLMANMVWSLPQYSLCFAVCEQNFFPQVFLGDGLLAPGPEGSHLGKWLVSGVVLVLCTVVTWSYGSGHWGVKLYDLVLKVVVALIVVCFMGVVLRMSLLEGGIDWGGVAAGLIPNLSHFWEPVATLQPLLDQVTDPGARQYWRELIVSEQRDVMIAAGAAAVGINMTFLLPYVLLTRGWGREFRGLTIFDLSTGTFIPFVLATGCIVIASAQQFHGRMPAGFVVSAGQVVAPPKFEGAYAGLLEARDAAEAEGRFKFDGPPGLGEQQMAATLVRRDTFDLANSLERLFTTGSGTGGRLLANVVFGAGVVAMTVSSISLMMLISGFVVCEILDRPIQGWTFRLGCMVSSVGIFWPLLWEGDARAWLTVVAGVYGAMLLPIAYVTFFVMMNRRSMLGDDTPTGAARWVWNILMGLAVAAATAAGVSAIVDKGGYLGLGFVAAYAALVLIVQFTRAKPAAATRGAPAA